MTFGEFAKLHPTEYRRITVGELKEQLKYFEDKDKVYLYVNHDTDTEQLIFTDDFEWADMNNYLINVTGSHPVRSS